MAKPDPVKIWVALQGDVVTRAFGTEDLAKEWAWSRIKVEGSNAFRVEVTYLEPAPEAAAKR